ncbi:MAG TPA: hypothetical protein VFK70_05000 [Vicinamibacteria bacterium]|nr:hypothetical protein [Vicinamibacteria bacterium]
MKPRHGGAVAAFAVLTVLATWPLASHFTTHVPGDPADPGDYWAYYWDLWWVKTALAQGTSPLHTSLVHHPDGADLSFHSLMLAPSALASPLTAAMGPTVAYNLLVCLSFLGSAFGVYLLVLELLGEKGSPLAAGLAGAGYAFSAYRFSRMMGHLDLLSTEWLPFAALFLVRSLRQGGRANAVGLTAFTVLTFLTNWYLGLALALLAVIALAELWFSPPAGRREAWRRIAAAFALAAALTAPVWAGMLRNGGEGGRLGDPLGDSLANSADLLGFVLPSSAHPLWGPAIVNARRALFGRTDNVVENTVFLGLVPLALGLWGWREGRSLPARLFRTGWVVFTMLSLGPYLHVAGHTVRIAEHAVPMPYLALYHLPYAALAHGPSRFVLMAGLCLAVLAGLGAQRLVRAAPERERVVLGALIALALFETASVPYPLAEVRVPAAYDHLTPASTGAILEVPIPDWPAQLPQRMLYQTRHGRPIFGGYLSRSLPPHPFHAVPGFRDLQRLRKNAPDIDHVPPTSWPAVARVALRAYGTTHVLLLKDDFGYLPELRANAGEARALLVELLGAPSFEDADSAVFAVGEASTPAFVSPERGFQPVEYPDSTPMRAVWPRARIGLWTPAGGAYEVSLTGFALHTDRLVQLRFDKGSAQAFPFSSTEHGTARYRGEAVAGWQTIDLDCLDPRERVTPAVATPCLVLTDLTVTESAR